MLLRILCTDRQTDAKQKNHDGPFWPDDPLLAVLVLYWKMPCNRDNLSSGTTDEVTLVRRGDNGVSERTGDVGAGEVESRLFDSSSVALCVRTPAITTSANLLDSVCATAASRSESSAALLANARVIYFRNAVPVDSNSFSTRGFLWGYAFKN